MIPHTPTPDWAIHCVERIKKTYDPDAVDAVMELLAATAPTEDQDKYKYELAWVAIDHAYKATEDCRKSARRYLGVAS